MAAGNTKQTHFSKRIVDVDVHLRDTPAALAPYCDMPWRKSLEIMAKRPYRHLDVAGLSPGLRADPPYPGGHKPTEVPDAKTLRAQLDDLGITDAILMPDNLLYFALLPNVDYAVAVSHAYNRWLTAEWASAEHGLWGALLACPQDCDDSIKEIERYADHPSIKAVFLPTSGVNPLWGARKYNKLLECIAATGLPAILHSVGLVAPVFPMQQEQFENLYARQVITHPFSMMANMVSLFHTGIPAKIPDLKFVYTEAGVAWVPFMMWRLDRYHAEHRRTVPFLEERPSDYLKRSMWFATQPLEEPEVSAYLVEQIRHIGGAERIMFASDWPHHDFDHPRAIDKLPLKPEEKHLILSGNAVEAFKLPELNLQQFSKTA